MGLTAATWCFSGAPPAIAEIAAHFAARTSIKAIVEPIAQAPDAPPAIVIAFFRERLFDWEKSEHTLRAYGFIPSHPYVWLHLHHSMVELGGTLASGPGWRPTAAIERLNRPWRELPVFDRLLLWLPAIGAYRPERWFRRFRDLFPDS